MTLNLDTSPARKRGRPYVDGKAVPARELPVVTAYVEPELFSKIKDQARQRGLSKTEYATRLLAAAAAAVEEQEEAPMRSTA